jgi:spermidine synthase
METGCSPACRPVYGPAKSKDRPMIPWKHLDTATIPGGEELRLNQRGEEFSIMLGRIELMNSRLSGSEQALATISAERIRSRRQPRILIGGLGMGFTLRAALAGFGPEATIDVAELVPEVVAWARGPLAGVVGSCVDDPRVTIHVGDVGALMRAHRATWDAILLDVDNGPTGLTRESNDDLYDMGGLGWARAALTPGGVLAVWSSGRDSQFTQRLRRAGFDVEEVMVRARISKGARHNLWFATA